MSSSPSRPLRRSLFFVPGGESRKLAKATTVGADTLLLDLEDSVPPGEKSAARELVAGFLLQGDFGGAEPAVRVNPAGTPYLEEDLEAVIEAGARAVMLPKCQSRTGLREVGDRIEAIRGRVAGGDERPIGLFALVETARGLVEAAGLGESNPLLEALCFGHADFSHDLGLRRADASRGVALHARCTLSIAARASGLSAVDTVYLDVRDSEGFRRDAELGRELGFEGKLCIHPAQVPIANQVHTPSAEQIDYAQRVVEASQQAQAEGRGVFTVDGKMVDAPLVAAQERILEQARRTGVLPSGEDGHGG